MRIREDELVRKIRSCVRGGRFSSPQIPVGIGDDAALFRPRPRGELVLTCDWFLEGTHFLRDKHPADSVGWKCLARSLSDVAAMGGVPRCFLLSLAIPSSHTGRWLSHFLTGLRRASRKFRCVLAGGDTTRGENILINVTVVGEVRNSHAIRRSGARPGDLIYVSGNLGDGELGLQVLKRSHGVANPKSARTKKHLYPEPRIALGKWLAEKRLASAMMDISDGLSTDLARLCEAGGVGAMVEECAIPLPDGIPKREAIALGLHGGDEYELLFTASPRQVRQLPRRFQGLDITLIGGIRRRKTILLLKNDASVVPLKASGWDPFRK